MRHLSLGSPLESYETQAEALLMAWRAADADAVQFFRHRHPRFLRDDVPWLPKSLTDEDILRAPLTADDARLATARAYDFLDWTSLAGHVAAMLDSASPVARFEAAVEAVIDGDVLALSAALEADPTLARARSTRVCHFDPPRHRATLLHYLAANGVEGYRQRTPPNAVDIARCLLDAGADPDALADLYGGQCTVLSMLVSSDPPARAGVQIALIDLLADRGATLAPLGTGRWRCPVRTALVFGFREAAHALVRRGAPAGTLPLAAGLGRVQDVERLLPEASPEARHEALALCVQAGEVDVLRVLLDTGEDAGRYNPDGFHSHATPLHQAVASGQPAIVQLLVDRGAPLDTRDRHHDATPFDWAEYLGQREAAVILRDAGTRS